MGYTVRQFGNVNIKITPEGGLAVKYINKTGSPSVKGYCLDSNNTLANSVKLVPINEPDCVGVFYESGIADGQEAWVVVSGKAEVYFSGNTTQGHLARTPITSDGAGVSGQALSEAVPTAPFATDKHFCEIGHVMQSRTGQGLALVNLHFN